MNDGLFVIDTLSGQMVTNKIFNLEEARAIAYRMEKEYEMETLTHQMGHMSTKQKVLKGR